MVSWVDTWDGRLIPLQPWSRSGSSRQRAFGSNGELHQEQKEDARLLQFFLNKGGLSLERRLSLGTANLPESGQVPKPSDVLKMLRYLSRSCIHPPVDVKSSLGDI